MGKQTKNLAHRRVVNACVRCRRHKIKCSGDAPCSNCENRQATCTFEGEEIKVQITKRRLSEFKRRVNDLEKQNQVLQQRFLESQVSLDTGGDIPIQKPLPTKPSNDCHSSLSSPISEEPQNQSNEADIVNPLLPGQPEYVTDVAGNYHYLGHSSNWSLKKRLLQPAHKTIYGYPFPSGAHHIDSMTYDFGWDGLRNIVIPDVQALPSVDHAIYLIQATEFHTGQICHLFDKVSFMRKLHWFYENPAQHIHAAGLWLIHFLAIISLGKAFTGSRSTGNTPPGAESFAKAVMMLPDHCYLWKSPCEACELLCTVSLYLQCIDWRTSAHNMINQAQRILIVQAFHVNINAGSYDENELTRRRNLWWTVFILERQMSVLLGVPLGISDQEITIPLPYFPDSQFRTSIARIHVKPSQAIGRVVKALYRKSDSLKFDLVKTTQDVLQSVATVAPDIRTYLPVPEPNAMSGISRVSGYINLLYHQCIMVAVRPFLFNLAQNRVEQGRIEERLPVPLKLLLQLCLDSAKKTIDILIALLNQTILDSFLPFDLESGVSAGLVVIMCRSINLTSDQNFCLALQSVYRILDKMIQDGNLIAEDQKTEIMQLQALFSEFQPQEFELQPNESTRQAERDLGKIRYINDDTHISMNQRLSSLGREEIGHGPCFLGSEPFTEDSTWADNISPSQLMDLVDMLDADDLLDWPFAQ